MCFAVTFLASQAGGTLPQFPDAKGLAESSDASITNSLSDFYLFEKT